ncbi:selenoprotein K-like [Zootermopsis nevadensis]|uniref:Selenoprotein K n=1 Tax=Zootermopsis nevadensis TaxID=136037 RepID=A0A067RC51_ZOONE|nr:selenoprotein K-like [Zootermopsis nevadensis]KDR20443.1 Selenoprotein K [Zootermopsis nevadensis]
MVYVSSSGTIQDKSPWSISRLIALLWGFLNFIVMFFKTLINPDMNRHGDRYTRDYRPGPGPPRPPQRRMGGFGSGSINSCASCSSG